MITNNQTIKKENSSETLIPDELIADLHKITINSLHGDIISRIYRDPNVASSIRSYFKKKTEHMKHNAIGQIYEAYIYLLLIDWAKNHDKITNFVLKGSNLQKIPAESKIPHGLRYNQEKQIIYESDGYSYGEFDAIFLWDNIPVLIEIKKGIGIKEEAFRKINRREKLLRKVFQVDIVICLLVNPNIAIPKIIEDLQFLKCINIPIPEEITNILLQKSFRDKNNKLIKISGKNFITLPFQGIKNIPYKTIEEDLIRDIRKTLKNELSMEKFFSRNREYLGIIQRLLLGEINKDQYVNFIRFLNSHFEESLIEGGISKMVIGLDLYPEKYLSPFIIIIKGKKDKICQYKLYRDSPTRKTIYRKSPLFKELKVFDQKQKRTFEYFELFFNKRKQFLIPLWRNI
ncbi:MAG: hypothetical protein HeimC3_50230 [Candidatus Heimdallarchaeota archaeon LC_3]|nr:MAG: hypothetical protein HeimC3_50230 [Candidatus Heimdallarchaeota archaeon LC_3]